MSRLNTRPRLNADAATIRELSEHAQLVNLMTDGRLAGTNNATTAAPTTGTHAQGDYVRNSTPSELGSAGSKYVIRGWICTVGGTPGTWLQDRGLTGN